MVGTLVSYRAGEYDYYAPDGRMRMSRSMEAQMGGVFQLFSLVCSGSSRNVTESFLCASDRKWSKDPEIDRVIAWRGGVEGGRPSMGHWAEVLRRRGIGRQRWRERLMLQRKEAGVVSSV